MGGYKYGSLAPEDDVKMHKQKCKWKVVDSADVERYLVDR